MKVALSYFDTPRETLPVEVVRRWGRGFVYAWRRGDRVLYVGATTKGIGRLQESGHRGFAAGGGMQPGDVIDLYAVPQGRRIGDYERAAIEALKPELNGKTGYVYQRELARARFEDKPGRQRNYNLEPFSNRVLDGGDTGAAS